MKNQVYPKDINLALRLYLVKTEISLSTIKLSILSTINKNNEYLVPLDKYKKGVI